MSEAALISNFNFGFSSNKSEILLHLSHWQYWWWFWFALLWSVYFYFILRLLNRRVMHFNPILNTSLRGHGKWGDFLVALIPLSWCGNILVNSNFILRMIEWQNESSLFTLRVQGKQWYWVYKFDSTLGSALQERPYNIGHNRWVYAKAFAASQGAVATDLALLATQLEAQNMYRRVLEENFIDTKNLLENEYTNLTFFKDAQLRARVNPSTTHTTAFNVPSIEDTTNFAGNLLLLNTRAPLEFKKGIINLYFLEQIKEKSLKANLFFVVDMHDLNGTPVEKNWDTEFFWGFRQRKYKRVNGYSFTRRIIKGRLAVLRQQVFANYQSLKYNKHRTELVPVTLARRLLRTKRTLVLPAHVNITVITNSYDVVHSWFIPGLGIKMDCVPGRSTHHTFYIDSVGFFYGQCAEICGRYHHHMPIRICALPIEQFVAWWEHKGLKRHIRLNIK